MAPKKAVQKKPGANLGKKYNTKTVDLQGWTTYDAVCFDSPENPIKARGNHGKQSKERAKKTSQANQALEGIITGEWFQCRCGWPRFIKTDADDKGRQYCDFPKDTRAKIGNFGKTGRVCLHALQT